MNDKRISSIRARALLKAPASDLSKFTDAIIKETVLECMKQLAYPVDMGNDFHKSFVQKQWDHLARRFKINE